MSTISIKAQFGIRELKKGALKSYKSAFSNYHNMYIPPIFPKHHSKGKEFLFFSHNCNI